MPGIYVKVDKGEGKMVIDGCIDQVLLLYKCLSLALYTHGDWKWNGADLISLCLHYHSTLTCAEHDCFDVYI